MQHRWRGSPDGRSERTEDRTFWWEVVIDDGRDVVLRLGGELDLATAPQLRAALDLYQRELRNLETGGRPVQWNGSHPRLVLELAEVSFLGVAAVQAIEDLVRDRDVVVEIREASPPCRRLLDLLGLPSTLTPTMAADQARHG